ncbi:MAG TPA: Zn-ribbon containing protein, partial [Candidatus Nanoarchaeia archaeon]|nr:Zn-ribbon containing protein [Candidatus Nanoarchaeia archaeon]
RELLEGCKECGSRFFFYVREEQLEKLKEKVIEIPDEEKKQIEKDIRKIAGIEKDDAPVILDFESIRVTGEGKFEIDLANLFNQKQPLVYKLEEGKYLIDLGKINPKEKKE